MADIAVRASRALDQLKKDLTLGEHVLNVFEAGLSAVPVLGGTVASLMKDYIPSQRAERVIQFAQAITEDLRDFADKISADYVKTDEFAFLFEQCFKGVSENYQAEKLLAYRAIILNALLHPEIPQNNKEMYLRIVNQLLPVHIHLLSALADPNAYVSLHGMKVRRYEITTSLRQLLGDLGFREDEFTAGLHDLDALGLTPNIAGSLNTSMSGGGVEKLQGRLTALGKELIRFIAEPS